MSITKENINCDYQNLINDEKHYVTLNNYLRFLYEKKVFKISLNGNFSCPNRDGKISTRGCLFCSAMGSGDYAGDIHQPIYEQFNHVKEMMEEKWHDGYYIAYFQANTNTYGSLDKIRSVYSNIINEKGIIDDKVKILSIATRPDCLDEEIVNYLSSLNKKIPVWVELGFQTKHKNTYTYMNRGYDNDILEKAISLLKEHNITVIVHIINGLPNETKDMMIETVKYLNLLPIDGIKIHMLHVMKNTPLGLIYEENNFPLLSLNDYVDIVTCQLRYLNTHIVIHRVTGDSPKELLIEPKWTLKKFVVINEIDKKMRKEKIYQGDLCIES